MTREARRRFAAFALTGLLALHVGAFGLYLLNEAQFTFLAHWRDGREAWRAGRLEAAAKELQTFTSGYRSASRPFLVRRDFPAEAQAWAALGNVEAALGHSQEAVEAYGRAAGLGQAAAWRERHVLLWTLRDATRLQQQGRQRVADGNPEGWEDLAAAAWLREQPREALSHYRAALDALPPWLEHQGRPPRAADGGLVDEELALYLLAGVTAWLGEDRATGQHYCQLLSQAQDRENPMDGLCRAAAALDRGAGNEALDILATTGVAPGEQAGFAAILRERANRRVPVRQSASPSPAPAVRPHR